MDKRSEQTNHRAIPEDLLSQAGDFIRRATGLDFEKKNYRDLAQRLDMAARGMGHDDPVAFTHSLLSSSIDHTTLDSLVGYLTTSETFFFRDASLFEMLEMKLLPELIASKKDQGRYLRIWSAGCATGEEPYSLAILLDRILSEKEQWHITILATDINREILERARMGIYSKWSFRNTPKWVKDSCFTNIKQDRFEIKAHIRDMVTFTYLNLSEDIYPSLINNTSGMDLILCRNVLMYFSPDYFASTVERFYRCLSEGGYLIVSPVEISSFLFSSFRSLHYNDVTLYQKDSHSSHEDRLEHFAQSGEIPVRVSRKKRNVAPVCLKPFRSSQKSSPARGATVTTSHGHRTVATPSAYETSPPEGYNKADELISSARIKAGRGALDEALALCDEALSEDTLKPSPYFLRAMILEEMNRKKEATAALKKVLYLDPRHVLAHFSLGNIARDEGGAVAASRHYAHTLALLNRCDAGEILPESEGMTAGRLREIVETLQGENMTNKR